MKYPVILLLIGRGGNFADRAIYYVNELIVRIKTTSYTLFDVKQYQNN